MPAGRCLSEGQLIPRFRKQWGWAGQKHGVLMNLSGCSSLYLQIDEEGDFLCAASCSAWGGACCSGSFGLGVTSS